MWLSLLGALPDAIRLFLAIFDYVKVQEERGVGRQEAIADGMRLALQEIAEATEAEREADADHAAHPGDDEGFDQEFKRTD